MTKVKKILLLIGLVALLTGVSTSYISAQQKPNLDITISPFVLEYSKNPGSVVKDKIRVRNNTTAPLSFHIDIKKLVTKDGSQIDIQDASPQQDDSISWIKFDTPKFTARPQEWVELPFTLTIPQDASFGYDWAIAVTEDNQQSQNSNTSTITGSAAIPVLLNVNRPGAKIDGTITTFTTDHSLYEYLPVTFNVTFQNTGNLNIKPHGNIYISDWRGKNVGIIDVNDTAGTVLPASSRTFTSEWDDSFISNEPKMVDEKPVLDKNGKPETSLKIRFDKLLALRVGKYKASTMLIVSGDQKDSTFEASTSFFVFPWKLILIIIGIAAFAAFGIITTLKSFVKPILHLIRKQKSSGGK